MSNDDLHVEGDEVFDTDSNVPALPEYNVIEQRIFDDLQRLVDLRLEDDPDSLHAQLDSIQARVDELMEKADEAIEASEEDDTEDEGNYSEGDEEELGDEED